MTSRPAAPESETPGTDAFSNPSTEGDDDSYITVENYNNLLEHSAKLERRLSLAQTEIKGHMRVEDELKLRIAELEKDNKLWHANWEAAHAEVQEARDFIVEQSKGNLGGGERPVEFLLASYKLMAHERAQAQARIAELEEDAARVDWVERYLCRAGEVKNDAGQTVKLARVWSIMGELETFRETVDAHIAALKSRA